METKQDRETNGGAVGGGGEHSRWLEALGVRAGDFETAAPGSILDFAVESYGSGLVVASSFQDAVLVDIAVRVDPAIEVVFLDTGAHFPETLAFVETVRNRYDLNLSVVRPSAGADDWPCGSANCCEHRKVRPLRDALVGRSAWATGLKRVDAPTRRRAPIIAYDEEWGMVKVNPLATWTEQDIEGYTRDHGLPEHPLRSRGYRSIGCAPTTSPVALGQDPRAGRWAGSEKVECGLHA
ncbi:MAG: phosphoadenylyl-sulfate reductase [Acidimicrobiales bacterium]